MRTICAWCKKKEKINGKWMPMFLPFDRNFEQITDGKCPECRKKQIEEFKEDNNNE